MSQSPKNRRTLRGQLVRPVEQLRLSFLLVGAGMLSVVVVTALAGFTTRRALTVLQATYKLDADFAEYAWRALSFNLILIVATALILGLASLLLSIRWTNRIFGPIVPIKVQLNRMMAGEYSGRVHLREGDEFGDVAELINRLSERLEKGQTK